MSIRNAASIAAPLLLGFASALAAPAPNLRIAMHRVVRELTALQPFLASEQKFTDPKNEAEIRARLDLLSTLFDEAIRQKELKSPTFRLTGYAVANHLRTGKQLYAAGQKEYARSMFQAVPSGCASCHTQVPQDPKSIWSMPDAKLEGSDFDRAEFLFATRNYDEALKHYARVRGPDLRELETALLRRLFIFVRTKRDLKGAITAFESDLADPSLPKSAKTYLSDWIRQLKEAAQEPPFDFAHSSAPQTLTYAKRWFSESSPRASIAPDHPKLVGHLLGMGALYGYLDTHATDASTPEILYWLAIGERAFSRNMFFFFGNMYLLECIQRYPDSPMAPRCYREYAEEMKFMYSGSRGTELPADVTQALAVLRSLVGTKLAPKAVK